ILIGGVLTLLGRAQENAFIQSVEDQMEYIVYSVGSRIRDLLVADDRLAIISTTDGLAEEQIIDFIGVQDPERNKIYYTQDEEIMTPYLARSEVTAAFDQQRPDSFPTTNQHGQEIKVYVEPIIDFDTFLGVLLIGFREELIGGNVDRRRRAILFLGAISIILGAVVATLLARNILSPIERLRTAAGRIGEGEFGETVNIETTDEIGALAQTFNTMSVELKKREVEVRRSERLTAIGTTASAIAHEMKTPITSIKTYVDMLPLRFDDPEFRGKFSHTIEDQTTRLIKLIDDLLDFSRETRLHLSDLDLNLQLHMAIVVFRDLMVANRVKAMEDYQSERRVKGDPDKLEQVFFNLLKNGIEAQSEGGAMAILTLDAGQEVLTVVADAGPGVESDTRDTLFEPFVTTKSKGTGLGLAIVKKVVTAHGGEIELFSPLEEVEADLLARIRATFGDHWPGDQQGSCFVVRLPAITESEN
ncbi:ATP-binding protein, partial [Gemmatimonadota bacterium]